jgi:hypothetical protein
LIGISGRVVAALRRRSSAAITELNDTSMGPVRYSAAFALLQIPILNAARTRGPDAVPSTESRPMVDPSLTTWRAAQTIFVLPHGRKP